MTPRTDNRSENEAARALRAEIEDALHESVTFSNIREGLVDTKDVDCRGLALQLAHIIVRNRSIATGTEEERP